MTTRTVMWFRRDLRIGDHPALAAAAARGPVLALFVVDPVLMGSSGAPRRAYLHDCLRALGESTGGRLQIRDGDPVEVVPAVAAEVGADVVHVTKDHGPYGRRRDAAVSDTLRLADRKLRGVGSNYAIEPGTVRKDDGTPYAVFTPFFRRWREHLERTATPGDPSDAVTPSDIEWLSPDAGRDVPFDRPDPGCDLPPAGEQAALERWHEFVDEGIDDYAERRDLPGEAGTSRLSPHLRWGAIHPLRLLGDLRDRHGLEPESHRTFASELAWRDFYADVLFEQPRTAWENLSTKLDTMRVDDDAAARERFDVWRQGHTGYPIVDAGMRQLLATGWMHNRVRMITASFLVKDLHLPWQWGAQHFMDHLVDGDLASNNHGWQWAAGTGTDAAPYFRVFNPTTQQDRYDPHGEYVARWVPELHDAADGYPAPMVDHAAERKEALARYETASQR